MPYIDKWRREEIDSGLMPNSPGELNYEFTRLAKRYFDLQGGKYQQINDILGAFEGAKLEFYRRVAVPYEEEKIKMNGDIFE